MGSDLSKVIQRQSWNLPLVTYPHIQTTGKCVLGAGAGTQVYVKSQLCYLVAVRPWARHLTL